MWNRCRGCPGVWRVKESRRAERAAEWRTEHEAGAQELAAKLARQTREGAEPVVKLHFLLAAKDQAAAAESAEAV